jgi:hypothetical protein
MRCLIVGGNHQPIVGGTAAQTFIVERWFDKEGVWMAMGPIKGERS